MKTGLRVTLAATILAALAGSGPRVAGQVSVAPSAAISGVVIDGMSKQPVRNAIVTLGGAEGGEARLLTDPQGRFLFRGLSAGERYTLETTKPGYIDGRFGGRRARTPRPIALADGQWFADARIEIVRPGSISGAVLDEAGEPVVRAFVRVLTQMWIAGRSHWVVGDPVQTDDYGRYRIGNLAAGLYAVSVPSVQNALPADASDPAVSRAASDNRVIDVDPAASLVIGTFVTPPAPYPGTPVLAYPTTYYPAATVLTDAQSITLGEAQDRAGVDVQIRPVPTWRVSGRLVDLAGAAAGVPLRLMAPGTETLGFGGETATTFADRQGRFTFLNVPEGHYTIDARRTSLELRYVPAGVVYMQPLPLPGLGGRRGGGGGRIDAAPKGVFAMHGDGSDAGWGRQEVDVDKGPVSDLVLEMRPGIAVRGRMVWEAQGRLEPKGSPVLMVLAEPAGPASLGMPSGAAQTGPATTFSVTGLLPGQYLLRPFGGGQLKSIVHRGTDYTYTPFDTSSAQDIEDVVITFTDQTSVIAGAVSPSSAGPDGAAVIVFPSARDRWTSMGFRPLQIRSVPVATNGRFSVEVPEGEYFVIAVSVEDADAWLDPAYLERAARVASRVQVSWGVTRMVTLNVSEVR